MDLFDEARAALDNVEDDSERLLDLVRRLVHHHHHPDPRRAIVQVVITDTEKVLLHAVEENAASEPINRDTATAAWTSDREDLVSLAPSDDGFSCEAISTGGGVGDTLVTATITEPSADGGTTPGVTYIGTQVVTVNTDETIAKVEITADAPEPR